MINKKAIMLKMFCMLFECEYLKTDGEIDMNFSDLNLEFINWDRQMNILQCLYDFPFDKYFF